MSIATDLSTAPIHVSLQRQQEDPIDEFEAARILGLKPTTLRAWRTNGRYGLPYFKAGRLVKYLRSEVERFRDRRTVTNTGEGDQLDSRA